MGRLQFKLKRKTGLIISFLVLPLSLIGFSMVTAGSAKLLAFWCSAHWVKVPAEIHYLEMKTHKDPDGTCYSVETQYSYNYNGIPLTSQRFNISSPARDTLIYSSVVKKIKRSGPPYCFVNPGNPSEAVLVRQIPPRLAGDFAGELFIIIFIFWWSFGVILNYMESKNLEKGLPPFIEKLIVNRENDHPPLPVLLLSTCFILAALDSFPALLSSTLGPELAVYFALGVIFLVLMVYLYRNFPGLRKEKFACPLNSYCPV